ncbi:TATA box-binding protein-associated factor RNA polymerase I subunit C [Dromiciops gliroides]|uniref:TATA box-binding protein-associated factor RNA polymerase I subunit C n=1 Tax=Dromiciops gliroides TaxID=33562 RepID=UPI001CC3B408|nr:TATA box-binding protein-associated factor RNA polymerase I subunit C [Dromiciops gliroides]XP_043845933.1 TATA box-binding protein-associated factor RNA polymerase I subunit C [Dromiciops gliroides]XP_043845934.1 TATA box-binding protein-associated factor RNA polymerase I subunit C [Dromiciops gliroides]
MDFPSDLFPTFFLPGPPGLSDSPGSFLSSVWSDYMQLLKPPQTQDPSMRKLRPWEANPQREASYVTKWGRWKPDTPGPLPFLHPGADPWDPELTSRDLLFRGRPRHPPRAKATIDVVEQLNHFLWDHGDIAFGPLGMLLQENFNLGERKKSHKARAVMNAGRLLQDLGGYQPKGCPWAHLSTRQRRFSLLGGTVLGEEVESLLGGLLHEELETRWKELLLDDACTGGALAWVPGAKAHTGQLVYPTGRAHNQLNFQKIKLSPTREPQVLGDPTHISLRGPVRQVVTRTVQGEALVAVRSDHHCAVWQVGCQGRPEPLQVLDTHKGATGISLSPHLPGELAVCTRSGTVCLWSPRDGLQQIHKDPETLVFKDPSSWRWVDFAAHPRMLTIADRTGVHLRDVRGPSDCGELLFCVGAEASCQRGERVLLAQYLGTPSPLSLSPTLHLICSQSSLYLLDERLPLVPMLKWSHSLMSPPLLAQLLPPPCPGAPLPLLLGGLGGHLRMLHLSGGSSHAPQLAAPPQSLPSLIDSLHGFPVLEPHGQQLLQDRLKAPLTGLAAVVPPSHPSPSMLLFQLSAAGDVFYQRLWLQPDSSSKNADSPQNGISSTDCADDPGFSSHDQTSATPSLNTASDACALSWNAQAVACCRRWLKTLLQVPPALPPWTPPTFSQHHHLRWSREEEDKGEVREGLQAAMTEGRLLQQEDLGPLPPSDPPPAHEPFGPEDKLSERLKASWEGKGAVWWDSQQGSTQVPRKRQKRRSQLSSSFSSVRTNSDFSDIASSPHRSYETPSPLHKLPETSRSLELSQELWAWSIPRERRQTLRDYLAVLPSPDSGGCSTPLSQNPSSHSLPTSEPGRHSVLRSQNPSTQTLPSQHTPSLAGSQPRKKKPRMGF